MSKYQFLILCFLFRLQSIFALFNDIEKADHLLSKVVQRLNRTNSPYNDGYLYSEGIEAAQEFLGNLKQLNHYKIPESDIFIQLDEALNPIPKGSFLDARVRTVAAKIDQNFDNFMKLLNPNFNNSFENIKESDVGHPTIGKNALFASILEVRNGSNNYLGLFWPLTFDTNSDYFQCGCLQDERNYLINLYKTLVLSEIKESLRITVMRTILGGPKALHEITNHLEIIMNPLLLEYTKAFLNSLRTIEPQYFRFCNSQRNPWISGVDGIDLKESLQQIFYESSSEKQNNTLHCINNQWRVYLGRLESRESDNYVITGMRFQVKRNVSLYSMITRNYQCKSNILYLQPAQGKLNPNGTITDYEWIPLFDNILEEYTAKLDSEHRSFFLDDVQLHPKYVMTGIKFDAVERGDKAKIGGFAISVSGLPLDHKSGKLNSTLGDKVYVRPESPEIENELIYKNVRPLDMTKESRLIQVSSPKQFTYITLQPSSDTDKRRQSLLPLFDATPVIMRRHAPLSGVALFHKIAGNDAGFISVKLRSLDYVPYADAVIRRYANRRTKKGWSHYLRELMESIRRDELIRDGRHVS